MRPAFLTALAGLAALAAMPVAAQDAPAAEAIVEAFLDRCAAIAAEPMVAVTAGLFDGMGAVTADGALLQINEPFAVEGDATMGSLQAGRTVAAAGTRDWCSVTFFTSDPDVAPAAPPLADALDAVADATLGAPAQRGGGPADIAATLAGETAEMRIWSVAGPDGELSLMQTSRVATISLVRQADAP